MDLEIGRAFNILRFWSVLIVLMAGLKPNDASAADTSRYYRRHITIVVDQTPKTSAGGYLVPIGNDIKAFLDGKKPNSAKTLPSDFEFDPKQDFLEVFLYGMQGGLDENGGDTYRTVRESREELPNNKLFENTIDRLVHPYQKWTGVGDFDLMWKNVISKAFNTSQTSVGKAIRDHSGYGFSAFLPNAVIKFMDKSVPAQEYYIICVSTFQTGLTGQNAANDVDVLGQIYGNRNRASLFDKWLSAYANPYQTSNWLDLTYGSAQDNGVSAIGQQLILQSAVNSSVNMVSNLSLTQKVYGGDDFTIGKIDVAFPKDENLKIKEIILSVEKEGEEICKVLDPHYSYDSIKKQYSFDSQDLELTCDLADNDTLDVKLVFTPETGSEANVLPFVFLAKRDMPVKDINFKPAPTMFYIVLVLSLIVLGVILWLIWKYRGKKATTDIKLNIWPISNSRYMDVTDNKVVNEDCWYYRDGEKEKNIQIDGTIRLILPKFAKKYKLVAEYQVEDVDLNLDFSFRPSAPDPITGGHRVEKKWYPLALNNDAFEFEVTSFLADGRSFNPIRDDKNILRLKVLVRTHLVDEKGKKIGNSNIKEKYYRFIVRPNVENSDIWMALDPGTSGSCIAYGWGGLPADTNNIHLAQSISTDTAGNKHLSPIFYSKILIKDHASIFKGRPAHEMQVFNSKTGKGDFCFGNEAHILVGRNKFQSIKKLLGYTNELEVVNDKGLIAKIKGEDLAHLLIKGLCYEFEQYVKNADANEVNSHVKNNILTDGKLTPSRAIVAVPNNYTVNKVQAMVDSIKRTDLFKEVHYLYEAEGVMMYFINHRWADLNELENKTFVVFDMGGATINATSFKIDVITGENDGNIYTRKITVDTISRVGYTVGGDNIDYALISMILNIPSFIDAMNNAGLSKDDIKRRQKKRLISFVQKLKLDYIESIAGKIQEGNCAKDKESFWLQIHILAKECGLTIPEEIESADLVYLESVEASNHIKTLVLDSVKDAIEELITDDFSSEIELILSGRSILYPRVKNVVCDTLKQQGFTFDEWDYNGVERDEVVKTAVVRGACWYAMNSKYVELRHDTVTSTFGYTDQVDQKVKFVPVIEKNTPFDENGEAIEQVAPCDPTINTIKFVQMLGSNYDEIYDNRKNLHKMAELTQISSAQIRGDIRSIEIKVDSNNNFSYKIDVKGESRPIEGSCCAADVDITDTNSEAYAFAALSSLEDQSVTKSDEQTNQKPNQKVTPKKRF